MLPPNNLPIVNQRGVKKLHPTDALQNFGTFTPGLVEEPQLCVMDLKGQTGYNGLDLGLSVHAVVDIAEGELLQCCVFGYFTTEEKYKQNARERGEPEEYPLTPGVFALLPPYENTVCVMAENCPARYINDSKGIAGAKPNIKFVQHPDPRELYYDPMKGMHLFIQAQTIRPIKALLCKLRRPLLGNRCSNQSDRD